MKLPGPHQPGAADQGPPADALHRHQDPGRDQDRRADLDIIEPIGEQVEAVLGAVPGTRSVFAERVAGGRYIEITPDRLAARRGSG